MCEERLTSDWGGVASQHVPRVLVLAGIEDKEVLEAPLQCLKGGPVRRVLLPAVQHDLVEALWRVGRAGHAVATLELLQHLRVGHAWVGDAATRHQLCQQDAKGPDVGLDAEPVVEGGLGRCPLDGELGAFVRVVLVVRDEPGQPKVGHLADVVVSDEDVSCGQVPVDVVVQLQVRHARRHLGRHVDELGQLERAALLLQVLEQAALGHEFGDDHERLLLRADGIELHQLGVPQLLHDVRLLEEGRGLHGARLEGLDGHGRGAVPQPLKHLPKLPRPQPVDEGDGVARDLPHVLGLVREVNLRLLQLLAGHHEVDAEAVAVAAVVLRQLLERAEHSAPRDEEATLVQAPDAVVLDGDAVLDGQGVVARLALTLAHQEGPALWVSAQ